MKISFIGLGKLGLPVAVAIDAKGHDVLGYDINPNFNSKKHPKDCLFTQEKNEHLDGDIQPMLEKSNVKFSDTLEECLDFGDIVFIAIQTPHIKKFGGQCPIPDDRADFDYTWLINAVKQISEVLDRTEQHKIVTIISTVLPGTLRKYIFPVMSTRINLCYNPFFIAMGTVVRDFYFPEFILLGQSSKTAEEKVIEFYKTITDAPVFSTTIENAELIKVSYNTFITTKVVMANNLMEMCHHLPNTDVDEISRALSLSNKRLISPAYLRGGMGDGGGCHPRDNIAMSWLSNKLGLKHNYYDFIMKKREEQSQFLADLIVSKQKELNLPICILGTAFKPETNLIDGSTALLLKHQLNDMGVEVETYDPYIDITQDEFELEKKIYFLGCGHQIFQEYKFVTGSCVIDPHRYLNKEELEANGVIYVPIGIGPKLEGK